MDRQKIFWVVLSVSVFVVVVLVVGVLLLRQKPAALGTAAPGAVTPLSDPGPQLYEYTRPEAPGAAGSGETETMHFVIGDTGDSAPASAPAATPAPQVEQPAAPAATAKSAPAVPAAQKAPAATPAAATAAPAPKGPEYWIQTGSYRSQTRAEELATMLEGKGLAGRVFSYASGADTYYRVRVGPYGNKGEAEKFLATVRRIQGLESSYISMVAGGRKLN